MENPNNNTPNEPTTPQNSTSNMQKKTTYTITGKTDGFGAQYNAIMSGIAYCFFKKYKYIHTPIKKLDHTNLVKELNHFMGIPPETSPGKIDISKPYAADVHFSETPEIYYTDEVLSLIRGYYYSTAKPIINNIDIAIHIRRGDVIKNSKIDNIKKRFIDTNHYIKIIEGLHAEYPDHSITIFSEGHEKDFHILKRSYVRFQLNTDIRDTFHSLVIAKVLVMARSSFSYAAALLNVNTIYYIDFWHKPLPKWKKIKLC